jgi:hypothetical protein
MNNTELDSVLKKARMPEPPEEFWEMFPQQVARKTNRARTQNNRVQPRLFPRFAWGLATAICILTAFAIGHWRGKMDTKTVVTNDVLQNPKLISETLAMFPNQVRAIVRDKHGLNLILSNNGDVPTSPPIYIRVCDGNNCSSYVTFSGQELEIAGQTVTILSDATGGVIVTGRRFVWASDSPDNMGGNLKIEAKNLNLITL